MSLQSVAAEWIFPISSPPLSRHALEFEDGVIRAVRPAQDKDPFLSNTALLPGLVNTHTHLAYTAMRNQFDDLSFFPWIRKLTQLKYEVWTPDDLALSTRLGILECLRAGITTVADLSDCETGLAELSKSPLQGIFYWELFGVEKEHAARTWQELQQIFPRLQAQYLTKRLSVGLSPHSVFTVRPELYRQVAEWALRDRIPISFHLAESKEEEQFIAHRSGPIATFLEQRAADWQILGPTAVSHLEKTGILQARPLLAHLVQATESDCELLSLHKVSVAHCPKSNAKFGHGIAPLSRMLHHGLQIGLGTDSAASNNRLDLFEEGRFCLLQQRALEGAPVMSEEQILSMLTLDGARAMGLQDTIGSLEPGKAADFICVNIPSFYSSTEQVLRHLVHNATGQDVKQTWVDGQVVSMSDLDDEIHEIYQRGVS